VAATRFPRRHHQASAPDNGARIAATDQPANGTSGWLVRPPMWPRCLGAVWSTSRVRLTNDCYLITLSFQSGVERYFKDKESWTKLTTRGRRMPATAEQVLNHLLPALAEVKSGVTVQVEHRDLHESAAQLLDRLRG
jgi:hypothetical protein